MKKTNNTVTCGRKVDLLLEFQLSLIRLRLIPNRGLAFISIVIYDSGNQSSRKVPLSYFKVLSN